MEVDFSLDHPYKAIFTAVLRDSYGLAQHDHSSILYRDNLNAHLYRMRPGVEANCSNLSSGIATGGG